MIELKDVSFSYNHKDLTLDNINLRIDKGEFIVLCGPNGAGKTTLARLLNALIIPASGDVYVDGMNTRDVDLRSKIRQKAGILFTNPDNQIFASTVEEDIAFGLENLCMEPEKIKERIEFISGLMGIRELMKIPPHFLSAGEKEKVALSGILAMEPEYVILDNPSLLLGADNINGVRKFIEKSNTRDVSIIYIVNYLKDIPQDCRVIRLEKGRICKSDAV